MSYLIGCIVAAISFMLNRALFKRIGYQTIITYSPVIEEFCKTLPAYSIGADILAVHVTFGIIEGCYDYYQNQYTGVLAGLLSIIGHFLFGLTAVVVLMVSGNIYLAITASCVFHLLWNVIVVRFF